MYSPQTHPKMFRAGKMTGAAFVRESRALSHAEDGLNFRLCIPHPSEDRDVLTAQLERVRTAHDALLAAYKEGR